MMLRINLCKYELNKVGKKTWLDDFHTRIKRKLHHTVSYSLLSYGRDLDKVNWTWQNVHFDQNMVLN